MHVETSSTQKKYLIRVTLNQMEQDESHLSLVDDFPNGLCAHGAHLFDVRAICLVQSATFYLTKELPDLRLFEMATFESLGAMTTMALGRWSVGTKRLGWQPRAGFGLVLWARSSTWLGRLCSGAVQVAVGWTGRPRGGCCWRWQGTEVGCQSWGSGCGWAEAPWRAGLESLD